MIPTANKKINRKWTNGEETLHPAYTPFPSFPTVSILINYLIHCIWRSPVIFVLLIYINTHNTTVFIFLEGLYVYMYIYSNIQRLDENFIGWKFHIMMSYQPLMTFLTNGIQTLQHQRKKYVNHKGDYVKKKLPSTWVSQSPSVLFSRHSQIFIYIYIYIYIWKTLSSILTCRGPIVQLKMWTVVEATLVVFSIRGKCCAGPTTVFELADQRRNVVSWSCCSF